MVVSRRLRVPQRSLLPSGGRKSQRRPSAPSPRPVRTDLLGDRGVFPEGARPPLLSPGSPTRVRAASRPIRRPFSRSLSDAGRGSRESAVESRERAKRRWPSVLRRPSMRPPPQGPRRDPSDPTRPVRRLPELPADESVDRRTRRPSHWPSSRRPAGLWSTAPPPPRPALSLPRSPPSPDAEGGQSHAHAGPEGPRASTAASHPAARPTRRASPSPTTPSSSTLPPWPSPGPRPGPARPAGPARIPRRATTQGERASPSARANADAARVPWLRAYHIDNDRRRRRGRRSDRGTARGEGEPDRRRRAAAAGYDRLFPLFPPPAGRGYRRRRRRGRASATRCRRCTTGATTTGATEAAVAGAKEGKRAS